ncbi:DciA family protein [Streptomyces mirabilis]|uniref:DciA family protein n=1 Tax=Streptomyces mirabilis TaxID=68239 RepID=UPI00368153B9
MTDSGDQLSMPSYLPGAKVDLARIALRAEKEAARRRAAWEGRPPSRRRVRKRRPGDDSAVSLAAAIDELFADVIGCPGPAPDASAVIADWDNLAEPFARHVRPVSFEPATGALSLQAVSKAWATNMRLLGPQVISQLNERLGSEQISQLRIFGPAAPASAPAKCSAAPVAPELQAALDRQLEVARREPGELFQAGREASARRTRTERQHAAIVRSQAQAKAKQQRATGSANTRGSYGGRAGQTTAQ